MLRTILLCTSNESQTLTIQPQFIQLKADAVVEKRRHTGHSITNLNMLHELEQRSCRQSDGS